MISSSVIFFYADDITTPCLPAGEGSRGKETPSQTAPPALIHQMSVMQLASFTFLILMTQTESLDRSLTQNDSLYQKDALTLTQRGLNACG
jgi:hypothetical protein